MKLHNYLLISILSIGLLACNKGEEINADPQGEGAKTVTLKVTTSTPVKSITEPSIGENRNMEFNDLLIVFYNQGTGNIFRSVTLTAADLTAATTGGYTFHNLSPLIDAAAVVANSDGENGLTAAVNTNISVLKVAVLDISKQQTMANNILLFDAQALESDEAITDGGHTGEATNKFKVTLNPKPQVARLEIGNIQCTDLGTFYDKFTIAGMGFINYAPTQAGWSNSYIGSTTPTYGATLTYEDQDAFDALVSTNPQPWNYDAATGTTEISSSATQYNPTAGRFCYNFFPNVMPHLKLKLSGVYPKGSSNPLSQDVYVTVTKYHFPEGVTTFEAGKIYQLDFAFTEKNLGLYDNKQICVEATVTINDWVIVPGLTPDFTE